MIGWLKKIFSSSKEIEDTIPPPEEWPRLNSQEEARIGRLILAIEQYKERDPKDPRLAGLRKELRRRLQCQ